MPVGTPIFRPALKNLILVPAGTRILKHNVGQHCVPEPISALFCLFFSKGGQSMVGMHMRQLVGGGGAKKQPLPPLFDPFTPSFLYKYNHGLHGKGGWKVQRKIKEK